jgi:hypothetical protein
VATYKVLQDIEAEDKILGPLTLRQFIFALIAVFCFYVCFILLTKGVAFLMVIFLPPGLFCAFFAFPFGRDQPTEIWALAKMRYWFKPRRRIWNQSGVKELVTITVPKKVERVLTNGLNQAEVKSRLEALADTIDSRGWAVKNSASDSYGPIMPGEDSQRLINIDSLSQEVPADPEVTARDDILDASSNPIAKQFDTMINQSSRDRRQQLVDQLNGMQDSEILQPAMPVPSVGSNNWFMAQGATARVPAPVAAPPVYAGDTPEEVALSNSLAAHKSTQQVPFGHLRTMQPLSGPVPADDSPLMPKPLPPSQIPAVTPPDDPAIISLAKNNDLNVATLARQARKNGGDDGQMQDEVVVSLH